MTLNMNNRPRCAREPDLWRSLLSHTRWHALDSIALLLPAFLKAAPSQPNHTRQRASWSNRFEVPSPLVWSLGPPPKKKQGEKVDLRGICDFNSYTGRASWGERCSRWARLLLLRRILLCMEFLNWGDQIAGCTSLLLLIFYYWRTCPLAFLHPPWHSMGLASAFILAQAHGSAGLPSAFDSELSAQRAYSSHWWKLQGRRARSSAKALLAPLPFRLVSGSACSRSSFSSYSVFLSSPWPNRRTWQSTQDGIWGERVRFVTVLPPPWGAAVSANGIGGRSKKERVWSGGA